jgi:YegS/Rv2252/BmrU family lipid kinase
MSENPEDQNAQNGSEGLLARLKALIGTSVEKHEGPRRIYAVINPAAGQDQPILKTLNAACRTAGVDYEVFITKETGDGRRFAQQAVKDGVDTVVVNGGDGTVMEVASGLVGSEIPLAIIPGGTANVIASELGIPGDLVEASALAVKADGFVWPVDMGKIGENYFMLRASMGFEAVMVEGADRELKDRIGVLAYTFSALQALADPPIARYHLELDGESADTEGLTCIIANSGAMGTPGLKLSPNIFINDGLLDVLVVRKADLPALISLAASMVGGKENQSNMQHWQVKEATISSDPPQQLQLDGEMIGQTPITVKVIPRAVRVIVPKVLDEQLEESQRP